MEGLQIRFYYRELGARLWYHSTRQRAFPVKIVDATTSSIANFLFLSIHLFAIDLAASYSIIQV